MRLPDFLIIGANKAGTSSLAYYCGQHPGIHMSAVKEPMFFTSLQPGLVPTARNSPAACFTLREYAALFTAAEPGELCGEASTAYLANPHCAVWIRKVLPAVKLVAVLRNPIERAVSAHRMFHGMGLDDRTFEEAVRAEMETGSPELPQGLRYLSIGRYGHQLAAFRESFPSDQILVGGYEEFDADTETFLARLFSFLGVAPFCPPDLSRLHRAEEYAADAHHVAPMDAGLRRRLSAWFEPDLRELAKHVEFEVMGWLG